MPAKQLDTSITDAIARRFLSEGKERDTLFCKRVTGLHLVNLKTGASWRYRYQDANGKRRVATIGRFSELKPQQAAEKALAWRNQGQDVLAEKQRNRKEAVEQAALAANRTIKDYIEGAYKRYQSRKKSGDETLAMIKFNFADLLDRDMATLTKSDILTWQFKRETDGVSHDTIKRAYSALTTMLRYACNQDPPLLENNPLEKVRLEKPTDTERADQLSADRRSSRRILTNKEISNLHDGLEGFAAELREQRRNSRAHGKSYLPDLDQVAYPHWFIPLCYCALYTGMRTGDLYSLTWEELNVNFGRLDKVPEKTRHHPKPARIIMDLPTDLLEVMRAWNEQQGKPLTGLIFPSPITGNRLDKNAHDRAWARVKRIGNLPDDLVFYSLRHHFISTLVAAGQPILTVARLVGHKGTAMIEANYGHLCPTASREAMDLLASRVGRRTNNNQKASA